MTRAEERAVEIAKAISETYGLPKYLGELFAGFEEKIEQIKNPVQEEAKKLVIKVDKFYKTRDGGKVYIYREDVSEPQYFSKFMGVILGGTNWYYSTNGKIQDGQKHSYDLIEEWNN